MPEIADWLKTLGMSEYAECLAEHGIDISVLPHLTDRDLKDIGVLLGHRRKLLRLRSLPARFRGTATRIGRSEAARHCRMPAAYRDVLRSGRLDGTGGETVARFDRFVA